METTSIHERDKNCNACGKELPTGWAGAGYSQYENALWIQFHGSYGEFTDNLSQEDVDHNTTVICHECAHALCDQHKWIADVLQPLRSHAHTTKFWSEHPDHEGWDKPNNNNNNK